MKRTLFFMLAVAGWAQTLPEGPGKVTTEKMCKPCHGLENVVRAGMTKDGWGKEVDEMVAKGANGTDGEIEQVIDYLAANFGPSATKKVNVNKASPENLVTTLGLSSSDAAALVAYRNKSGKFKDIQDLTKVPGIDTRKIDAAKNRIEF
jgi:competence protein ComEA